MIPMVAEVGIGSTMRPAESVRVASMTLQKLATQPHADQSIVLCKDVPRTVPKIRESANGHAIGLSDRRFHRLGALASECWLRWFLSFTCVWMLTQTYSLDRSVRLG